MNHDRTERSLPTLFSDLAREVVDLIRKEAALARAEVAEKISSAESGITAIAIGAAVILAGLFLVLQAVVAGVELALPPDVAPWAAPLVVGIVVAVIGYLMLKSGQSHLKAENLMPERTINSLRTDRAIVQEKAR